MTDDRRHRGGFQGVQIRLVQQMQHGGHAVRVGTDMPVGEGRGRRRFRSGRDLSAADCLLGAHGCPPPPGMAGPPAPARPADGAAHRELMTCGRTGRTRSPPLSSERRTPPRNRDRALRRGEQRHRWRGRPVSRGVCPRRFGGLRDCGEDLLLRRPVTARFAPVPELSRQGSLTSTTLPAAVLGGGRSTSKAQWALVRVHHRQNPSGATSGARAAGRTELRTAARRTRAAAPRRAGSGGSRSRPTAQQARRHRRPRRYTPRPRRSARSVPPIAR